jgi:hypothetical protein
MYKTNPNPPALQPGFDFMPPANHAERLYRIARELATDEAGLMKQARDALKAYDAAIRTGEDEEAAALRERLDAIAERLPEDDEEETGHESLGHVGHLGRLLAAVPGQVPLWGQHGGFVVTVGGCRVVIRSDGLSLHASAFDWDKPFLNETGYLELYDSQDAARGRTVKQCALWLIRHRRTEWHRGKQEPRRLVPIAHYDWVFNEETRHNEKLMVTPGPDEDDRDWQPGGWLYDLKNKR